MHLESSPVLLAAQIILCPAHVRSRKARIPPERLFILTEGLIAFSSLIQRPGEREMHPGIMGNKGKGPAVSFNGLRGSIDRQKGLS